MDDTENLHEIQRKILNKLLFKKKARFSELHDENVESDQFNFHLKRLIELALVEKDIHKNYKLSIKGKEYANRFDTDKAKIERQAKIGILVGAIKNVNRENRYLIQKRLKQPYFGYHGFITGKVRWGETIQNAAEREFTEETGLTGDFSLRRIKHKMDYSLDGKILEDKVFFVFLVENTTGNMLQKFDGGENMWLSEKEIRQLDKLFDGVDESLQIVLSKELTFREDEYKVLEY